MKVKGHDKGVVLILAKIIPINTIKCRTVQQLLHYKQESVLIHSLSHCCLLFITGPETPPSTNYNAGTCSTSIKVYERLCGEHEQMFGECSSF